MLEFISVLMKILILEAVLLIGLALTGFGMLIKQIKGKNINKNIVGEVISEFKKKVSLKEDYSNLYKAIVVLFGVTKLTAIWCFSVLFGVMVTSNIWFIVGLLALEMSIIAIELKNRFTIDEKDIINVQWVMNKVEGMIQRVVPSFSGKDMYEGFRSKISKYISKENKNK